MNREDEQMPRLRCAPRNAFFFMLWCFIALIPRLAWSQISPAEIANPELKPIEQKYFFQLQTLNQAIAQTKFPFTFALSRYVGLDPDKQAGSDSRGIEFVRFHERTVLKISGSYNAAYNADKLTQNERAGKTFEDVVERVLPTVIRQIPADIPCDAIGFEIAYHVRTPNLNYDFEGKEILVAVFTVPDALSLGASSSPTERQNIVSRSEIYVNGSPFGLDLGQRDPIAIAKSAGNLQGAVRLSLNGSATPGERQLAASSSSPAPGNNTASAAPHAPSATPSVQTPPAPVPAQSDADQLQSKYQSQFDSLVSGGAAHFHFVDYAPPAFAIFQKQIALQLTLRNSARFDPDKTSIYKRAAQSFDLFLAPLLKDLLEQLHADSDFQLINCTVLNQLSGDPKSSSEAVEFVMPLTALIQFANSEATTQQLIDQSIVLVNGVRIGLNLQVVE